MAITSWLCDKRSCANKYWLLLIALPLIACGWLVPSITAQAASFDCARAATKVERLICDDAELSKLDDELKTAYKSALQDEHQAEVIRYAQKQWMKERNGCTNAACVKRAYETRLRALCMTDRNSVALEEHIPGKINITGPMNDDDPYIVLECRDSVFNFVINWRESVGKLKEKRRHLFYHVDGDSHLMLPVLDSAGVSTGYVFQTQKAKSLVYAILSTLNRDFIPIGVFPAGRDPVTGEWISVFFSSALFRKSALSVGKACNFDPTKPVPNYHDADKIPPAPVGSGID